MEKNEAVTQPRPRPKYLLGTFSNEPEDTTYCLVLNA